MAKTGKDLQPLIKEVSKLKIEPKIIELEQKYSNDGKLIIQIQPFLLEFHKVYNGMSFNEIPKIDVEKYNTYLADVSRYKEYENKIFWQNISHKETDEIINNAKGNWKKILLIFIEKIEILSKTHKSSNSLINYFNEQMYYLLLASEIDSPKFATEMYLDKVKVIPYNYFKFYFIDCARAFFEIENKAKKNDSYEFIISILRAKANQIKLIMDKEKKQQTTTQPTPPQKELEPIDSTLHQQFLIFHYLFKHLEISINSIDKTQIARFIQFATQKQLEAKKIQNTSIYKLVDKPFNGYKKDNGTTQTNLQKVRELFESIGLKEIAEIVSKDII